MLAVRSYRTISPLPKAKALGGIFLLHFPSVFTAQVLPGTLPYGARTFLLSLKAKAIAWSTPSPQHTPIPPLAQGILPASQLSC